MRVRPRVRVTGAGVYRRVDGWVDNSWFVDVWVDVWVDGWMGVCGCVRECVGVCVDVWMCKYVGVCGCVRVCGCAHGCVDACKRECEFGLCSKIGGALSLAR